MKYGYWMPVFGGWLRNVEDEHMEARWAYVRDLASEWLTVVQRMWREEVFDFSGTFYRTEMSRRPKRWSGLPRKGCDASRLVSSGRTREPDAASLPLRAPRCRP